MLGAAFFKFAYYNNAGLKYKSHEIRTLLNLIIERKKVFGKFHSKTLSKKEQLNQGIK